MMEARELERQLDGAFLQSCLYAMRHTELTLRTADDQSIHYAGHKYYIGTDEVPRDTVVQAVEYYYQHEPGALEEDSHYIRKRVMAHRLDRFNGTPFGRTS